MLAYLFEAAVPLVGYIWMGRRQAVRHKVLILACGGSNPSAPAILVCYYLFRPLVIVDNYFLHLKSRG